MGCRRLLRSLSLNVRLLCCPYSRNGNQSAMKRKRKQSACIRVSPQQLTQFGLERVKRDPLVVRCAMCGAEWQPTRLPQAGMQNTEWHCRNGCHKAPAARSGRHIEAPPPAAAGAFLCVGLAGGGILYLRRFIGITRPRGICKGGAR
jgi:hypothetical protein